MNRQVTLATAIFAAAAMLLLTAEAPAAFVWDGGGADGSWADDNNWEGGTAPAATTTERVDINETQTISTSVLDQDRTIGGVFWQGFQETHTFDLGGHTLTVAGQWETEDSSGTNGGQGTITNGTLKFGNDATAGSIRLDAMNGERGNIQFADGGGGKIETYDLGSVYVGSWGAYNMELDLQNATVVGGTFETGSLTLDHGGQVIFPDSTKMSKVYIRGTVDMEGSNSRQDVRADIPAGVDLQIGVDAATPGQIRIGPKVGENHGYGRMNALGAGGTAELYLDEFLVGRSDDPASMDLTAMTSGTVDASTADVEIGTGGTGDGMVGLPAGTATFKSLTIGQTSGGAGLLRLAGTDLTVNGALVINSTGSVDLVSGSGFGHITVLADGSLTIDGSVLDYGTYTNVDFPDHITGDGAITFVPEPATVALLGLGGLMMVGRRRRRA